MKPIITFKDNEELKKYLRYWQDILQLNDWHIKAELVDSIEEEIDSFETTGKNLLTFINKHSYIRIKREPEKSKVVRDCQELVLIHELLHCEFAVQGNGEKIEQLLYETMHHQQLETTAKALLRARYNLPMEWFYND